MSNFIPLSRYDADVNTIANYQIVPFDWVMKDGAFVMRTIELLELNKLKFFIEEFNKLTGYDVDLHHAKEEELNLLVSRGVEIFHKYSEDFLSLKRNHENMISRIRGLKDSDSSDDVNKLIDKMISCESQRDSMGISINRISKDKDFCLALLHMLRNNIGNGGYYSIGKNARQSLDSLPEIDIDFNFRDLKKDVYGGGKESCHYVYNEIAKVENAIKSILSRCTPPKDRFLLSQNGKERADSYKHYYSVAGETARQDMPAKEYVELMLVRQGHKDNKINKMLSLDF